MTAVSGRFGRCLAQFAGVGLGTQVFVGIAGLGLGGLFGWSADAATAIRGCAISWLAGCVGSIPVAWALARNPVQVGTAILGSTALRFVTVLALVLPAVLIEHRNRAALVGWVMAGYLAMLAADTALALHLMRRLAAKKSS